MIFTNARVVRVDGVSRGEEIAVAHGRICAPADLSASERGEILDLRGSYLAPGFIDLHVHGAAGRDAMEGTPDAFRAICAYHASGGTTSLLLTTATAPLGSILDVLRAVRSARAALPQIAGVHVEGPFISPARAGAQRTEFIVQPNAERTAQLLAFADVIKRVTVAPEIGGVLELIERLREYDIAVSGGHSDAWDEDARAAFERGMQHVTHTFNCMSSARRREGSRVAGLLEFALSEPAITCELIADGHHVSLTLLKMLYRAKRSEGICLVTDATAGAGLADGSRFELAGVDCIVANGGCFLSDRVTLAGSAARMCDLVRTMVREVGVPLHEAIAMASANPARALGLSAKGTIRSGGDADLCVLNEDLQVVRTFSGGRETFRADLAV